MINEILTLGNLQIILDIKLLPRVKKIKLESGYNDLDVISLKEYFEYDYWRPLAIYNDILSPFNLTEQGLIYVELFSKSDFDNLIREYMNG